MLGSARSGGVDTFVVPGIDEETSRRAVSLCRSERSVFCSVGIHPADSREGPIDSIARLAFEPGVRAIGETGLDAVKPGPPMKTQISMFEKHIELAGKLALPLVVHSRGAEREVLEVLPEPAGFPVVLHCYTGGVHEALDAARRGFFVSFAGALTWRRNSSLREVAASLPHSRVLAETDSPFMSPEGMRGARNEPLNVRSVVKALSGAWGVPMADCSAVLYANAMEAFRLGPRTTASLYYVLGRRVYVNLTGRCDNDCSFCIRNCADGIGGYLLRQEEDQPVERFLDALPLLRPADFEELVFCGFGEPTMRPGALESLASLARGLGWKTRLNTNGHAAGRLGEDRLRAMLGLFDAVSVSLNAPDEGAYEAICRPAAEGAWRDMLRFIRLVKGSGATLRLSAVRGSGADIGRVRDLARSLGSELVERGGP